MRVSRNSAILWLWWDQADKYVAFVSLTKFYFLTILRVIGLFSSESTCVLLMIGLTITVTLGKVIAHCFAICVLRSVQRKLCVIASEKIVRQKCYTPQLLNSSTLYSGGRSEVLALGAEEIRKWEKHKNVKQTKYPGNWTDYESYSGPNEGLLSVFKSSQPCFQASLSLDLRNI